jgi:heat shock protein HslJ
MRSRLTMLVLVLALAGCNKPEKSSAPASTPAAQARSIENRDWDLVAIGERDHPLGGGGKPATLRFDTTEHRASGNAGCNRYSASYRLSGDSLSFGPAMSTKMACADGMELESAWLGAIAQLVTWSATDSTLTLNGADGPMVHFEAHREP